MRERHLPYAYQSLSIFYFLICLCNLLNAQTLTVTDSENVPLMSVEVYTDNFAFAQVTNEYGQIILPKTGFSHLNFNYLGFKKERLSHAQLTKKSFVIALTPVDQLIEEVIVLGRNEVLQEEIPYQIRSILQEEIASMNAQTSADALSQLGGVYIQKSQLGGGSPVIRGFEANRVLLVVDGIRMNNAIYRNGHLQNAITVDNAVLKQMDVIFGPNSLMYGSDALGGVVHFQTRDPRLSLSDNMYSDVQYYVRHSTANRELSSHLDFTLSGKSVGSLTSITFSDYGDLRTGAVRDERFPDFGKRKVYQGLDNEGLDIELINEDPNVQIGTGYRQFDILQKFRWKPNLFSQVMANLQYSTSSDLPRYDNLAELRDENLRWGEWNYGPQNRFLSSLSYRNFKSNQWFDSASIIAAFQKIDEDRISRRFARPEREIQEEDVVVGSLTFDFVKYLDSTHTKDLTYGLDIQHNSVISKAKGINIQTGFPLSDQLSRYASDLNQMSSFGLFLQSRWRSQNEWFIWNLGARYSGTIYTLRYSEGDPVQWPSSFVDGVNGHNGALTWSIGGTMNHPSGWQVRGMISTAFRSPNIDDLSKIRVNSNEITFPNLDLKPEKSFNVELTTARSVSSDLKASITAFYTRLNDAIVRTPFTTPEGSNVWVSGGDTLQVVANQNVQSAYIYGVSANVEWKPVRMLSMESSLNITRGRELVDGSPDLPLAHIPPVYGQTSLVYSPSDWEVRFVARYNGKKNIDDFGGSADNPDLATPIGSLGWTSFNLYGKISLSPNVHLSGGIENIMDTHYRPFASGVSSAGRNFILTLRGSF